MIDLKKMLIKLLDSTRRLSSWNKIDPDAVIASRLTSANIASENRADVKHFIATSSMTEGKPPADGNILSFGWDNGSNWDTQLAVLHGDPPVLCTRYKSDSSWHGWHEVGYIPDRKTITGSGSKAIASGASGASFELCSVTLPAELHGSTYLIISRVGSNSGKEVTLLNAQRLKSGSLSMTWLTESRVTTTSGQGVFAIGVVKTKPSTAAVIKVDAYNYTNNIGAYTISGTMVAVKL